MLQGSPISPILFFIYIKDLFKFINIKLLSYVNNIILTASFKSFKQNIKILKREVKQLIELGEKYSINFDIEKIKLIHFYNGKQNTPSITLSNSNILEFNKLVKWLGIHFNVNLTFKEHRAIKTSLAKQMFYKINRLFGIIRGLSPFAIRQLYLACVTSVADYGSILWWSNSIKTQTRPFQAIQNLAIRKILGVFKTAPIIPIEFETALPPPNIRFNYNNRCYIFRALKLNPNHPIRQEVDKVI